MLSSKHILLILTTLYISHFSYAQQYKDNTSVDYEKARNTFNTLLHVNDTNIGKALNGADSLINAGKTNGNYMVTCLGHSLKGNMYYRLGKIENAVAQITLWKDLAAKNNNYEQYFNAYYYLCDYEKYINSAKSLIASQKMIAEARQRKNIPGLAWAHETQGNLALYILQDYPTASYHYEKAISLIKESKENTGPKLPRLYIKLANALGEEHKFTESEKILSFVRKVYSNTSNSEQDLNILIIQLNNAYNTKADAATFDNIYKKVISHPAYTTVVNNKYNQLFYKIRWLIRTNKGTEALAYIPRLDIATDRYSLKADAYESLGDWHHSYMMKDSADITRDSLIHEMRNEEFKELDAEMNNSELAIEAADNKAQSQYVLFGSILTIFIVILAAIGNSLYMRRKRKLENERELFVRNVTHQLRTPMTVVTGMVDQLKEHIPADDSVGQQNIEATKRQSRKLQELIMQLARMSKNGIIPLVNKEGDTSNVPAFATAPKENKETPALTADTDKPTILIAEDTDDVAMMMCHLLENNNYSVTRAIDGQEALEMLQHELPDLLITDVAMPRMDGLELMRFIRNDDTMCHLPIIVASARVEDSERMEGISAGAEVYLTKPFIPEELLLNISTMLEQRRRLRHSFSHTQPEKKEERTETEIPQMSGSEKRFIDTIDKLIDDNMTSGDININYIAEKMCMSTSTLNRKMKNITGMPAATYTRTRRIIKAKQLLRTTEKSITEIEMLCGFSTPGHFSRLFKAETGMSPSEYRQKKEENA